MAGHNDFDVQIFVSVIAKYFGNLAFCFHPVSRPFGNRNEDAGTAARICCFIQRYIYIFPNPFIIRANKSIMLFSFKRTDQRFIGPFNDADDFAFLFVAAIAVLDNPDRNFIIVHRCMAILFRNIYVFLQVFTEDKTKRRGVSFVYANNFLWIF